MQWIERVGHKGEERDGCQASTARQAKGQVVDKAHKTEEGGERRERGESGNGRDTCRRLRPIHGGGSCGDREEKGRGGTERTEPVTRKAGQPG